MAKLKLFLLDDRLFMWITFGIAKVTATVCLLA